MESVSTSKRRLPVIGLTGGIGTGKSTAARYFQELGALIIDADRVGKEIADSNPEVKEKIKFEFGRNFFDSKGNLKRKELGNLVFANNKELQKLNNILHPLMIKIIEEKVQKDIFSNKYKMIIVDAAIIFELNQEKKFDFIVTVSSNKDICRKRILKKNGISSENFEDRFNSQINPEIKEKKSDYVIKNNGTINELRNGVNGIFNEILESFKKREI